MSRGEKVAWLIHALLMSQWLSSSSLSLEQNIVQPAWEACLSLSFTTKLGLVDWLAMTYLSCSSLFRIKCGHGSPSRAFHGAAWGNFLSRVAFYMSWWCRHLFPPLDSFKTEASQTHRIHRINFHWFQALQNVGHHQHTDCEGRPLWVIMNDSWTENTCQTAVSG